MCGWLCNLKTDFDDPDSPAVGTEFVGTSIASTDVLGAQLAYGRVVLEESPHVRYFNNERGYARCRLTPEEWRRDFRVVPYVKRSGAPVQTRASFVIEEGHPTAHQIAGAKPFGDALVASRAATVPDPLRCYRINREPR